MFNILKIIFLTLLHITISRAEINLCTEKQLTELYLLPYLNYDNNQGSAVARPPGVCRSEMVLIKH
jgi:hypothetical protein